MADVTKITVRRLATHQDPRQFVELAGTRIGLRVTASKRDDRWDLRLVSTDYVEFAGPIRLVPGIDLFAPVAYDPRVPRGQLFVHSLTREPATLGNVDVVARLLFRPL